MRKNLIAALLLAAAPLLAGAAHAQGQDAPARPPAERDGDRPAPSRLFISPMGEPFRGGDAPQDRWFDQADTNHDGVLTVEEFEADAQRFFLTLDRNHDGEIDPDEIEYYETMIAPEIRVGGGGGPGTRPSGGGRKGGGGGGRRGGGGGGGGGGGRRGGGSSGGGQSSGSDAPQAREPTGQGAGRFGYLDIPEPVASADYNFNRGVDPREFQRAADERFALLDTKGDGRITKSELPKLAPAFGRGGFGGGQRRRGEGMGRPAGEGRGPPPDGAPSDE